MMDVFNSIVVLTARALNGDPDQSERLAVYDCVQSLAVPLAEKMVGKEGAEIALLALKAASAAEAIRRAEKCQLDFEALLEDRQ